MRRKRIGFLIIFFLIIFGVVFAVEQTDIKENFVIETHTRDENISRNFEMLTLKDGSINYHMEIANEDGDNETLDVYREQLLEISSLVEKMLETAKISSAEKTLDIYFIEDSPEGDICFYDGGEVLVDKETIGTEEFFCNVISLVCDCEEWVSFGLNSYLNGIEADEEFLKEYYSKEENIEDLSLFGGKFFELNLDEEERRAVQHTAISLFKYVAEEKDVSILFDSASSGTETIIEWKNEWLQERNGTATYENEKENIIRQLRFYTGNEEYPVQMKWKDCIFHLDKIALSGLRIENMSDLEYEYLIALEDAQGIEKYLYENLSEELIEKIEARRGVCNCYFFDGTLFKRSLTTLGNEVFLADIGDFSHEYVHVLLGIDAGEWAWLYEGLATNLGSKMYGKSFARLSLQNTKEYSQRLETEQGEEAESGKEMIAKYYEWGGNFEEDGYDYELLNKADVYLIKTTPGLIDKPWIKLYTLNTVYGTQLKNGTGDWSYGECQLFTAYLIEEFGIEKVIELAFNCSNSNFEKIFGDTMLNLHTEWEKRFIEENTHL